LRIDDERAFNKIHIIKRLLYSYGKDLADSFVVATENRVRFGVIPRKSTICDFNINNVNG
jgi:hypothetical protein